MLAANQASGGIEYADGIHCVTHICGNPYTGEPLALAEMVEMVVEVGKIKHHRTKTWCSKLAAVNKYASVWEEGRASPST